MEAEEIAWMEDWTWAVAEACTAAAAAAAGARRVRQPWPTHGAAGWVGSWPEALLRWQSGRVAANVS